MTKQEAIKKLRRYTYLDHMQTVGIERNELPIIENELIEALMRADESKRDFHAEVESVMDALNGGAFDAIKEREVAKE